jgi:hypothetical protein
MRASSLRRRCVDRHIDGRCSTAELNLIHEPLRATSVALDTRVVLRRFEGAAMNFQVGQQVICVSDSWLPNELWHRTVRTFPQLNSIYTIHEIRRGASLIGFCFCEFVNPRAHFRSGCLEPAFKSQNFRPVRKTSIELFERLLVPADSTAAPRKQRRVDKVPA